MKRFASCLAIGFFALAVAGTFAAPAFAHETRVFGDGFYVVVVGWHEEPAFEDEGNGLDFFISYDTSGDGECHEHEGEEHEGEEHEPDCIPVDVGAGDVVDLDVRVLYLRDDAFDAQVLASDPLEGDLVQAFGDPSRYTIFLKPNVEGAYGFRVSGTIHKVDQDEPAVVLQNEKFVCGGGTQGDEAFDCVEDILQPFPRGAFSSYRNDQPLH
jgi:hypothetical protein